MDAKKLRRIIYVLFILSEISLLTGFFWHLFRDVYLLATGTVLDISSRFSALALGMYYPSAAIVVEPGWHTEYLMIIVALSVYFVVTLLIFVLSPRLYNQKVGIYIVFSRLFLLLSSLLFVYFQTTGYSSFFTIIAPALFIISFLFFSATMLNTLRLHRIFSGADY